MGKIINRFKIQTYNIGFVEKSISDCLSDGLLQGDIKWLRHDYKDRFFADPFLIRKDKNHLFILCEEYVFWKSKGMITLLTVDRETYQLISKKVIIEESYHLSFPFCEENGEWIIPESSIAQQTYAYKINTELNTIIDKRLICENGLVDCVFYKDKSEKIWAYGGKAVAPSSDLYALKMQDDGRLYFYKDTPVLSDYRSARGAGRLFFMDNELYRPVQDCKGRYGHQTRIMKISRICEKGYEAEEVKTLNSFLNPPFSETMHTFNVYDDITIVDGSKDYIRFPMKFFYKKMPWLFSF